MLIAYAQTKTGRHRFLPKAVAPCMYSLYAVQKAILAVNWAERGTPTVMREPPLLSELT
jgi:hypothetical protein